MRLGASVSERDRARLDRATAPLLLPGEVVEYATTSGRSTFVVVTQWRLLLVDGSPVPVLDLDGVDARMFRWVGPSLVVWTPSGELTFGRLDDPADGHDLHAAVVWVGQQPAPVAARAEAAELASAAVAAIEAERQARADAKEAERKARVDAKAVEKQARADAKEAERQARVDAEEAELAKVAALVPGLRGAIFPAKSADLQPEVLDYLDRARREARSDIRAEEAALWNAYHVADKAGFGRVGAVRTWIDAEVAALEAAGELRIDSRLIGVVVERLATRKLYVYSDRIRIGKTVHVVDPHVQAAVEIDGAIFERSRPTLTRMTLLSPLPGSAVGAGLATQKTTTSDKRTASFILTHPDWSETIKLDPAKAHTTRPIAHRLNAIAAALGNTPPSSTPTATKSASPMGELRAELERVAAMLAGGLISDEEAAALRARLLG
jgi:hypothetical protein